jgi:hypothetical protein
MNQLVSEKERGACFLTNQTVSHCTCPLVFYVKSNPTLTTEELLPMTPQTAGEPETAPATQKAMEETSSGSLPVGAPTNKPAEHIMDLLL